MTFGPMQWTPSGMVPVRTSGAAVTQPGAVLATDPDDDAAGGFELGEKWTPSAPKQTKKSVHAAQVTPKNIVSAAKVRLREIRAEIRRMKRLEKERDELERLVSAAENKPRAIVREIKRTAG